MPEWWALSWISETKRKDGCPWAKGKEDMGWCQSQAGGCCWPVEELRSYFASKSLFFCSEQGSKVSGLGSRK